MSRTTRITALLIVLAFAAGALAGCSGEPSQSGGQQQGGQEAAKKGAPAAAGQFELIYYDLPG